MIPGPGLRETFAAVTGHPPYNYQVRLGEMLASGDSVVFRAPTGAGKTWAVTVPYLHGCLIGQTIADRMIYCLPLRSLASSLHKTVTAGAARSALFAEVHHAGKDRDYRYKGRLHCSLQIGGEKNDPFLESDAVFTTIDQVLSGYLMMPVSLPPRLDNMVAGALVGSYLVFDEAHLLDYRSSFSTMVEMLDRLRGLCRFVIMTATMSDAGIERLAKLTGAKALTIPAEELRTLPSQRTKKRSWSWTNQTLGANSVVERHCGGRSIALVNTVSRAQRLFEDLRRVYRGSETLLLLLHSRFRAEDRARTEAQLADALGPNPSRTDVILVSTQVVEAGIDISADVLHTELAPMNALIQRAGRCARYESRPLGHVLVYEPGSSRPYVQSEVDSTRTVLASLPETGTIVDFAREQEWIDAVHGPVERRELKTLNLRTVGLSVNQAIDTGERSKLSELVRDIDSVNVLIADDPNQLNFSGQDRNGMRIGWPEMFSIPRTSVLSLANALKNVGGGQWVAKRPEESSPDDRREGFVWHAITNTKELRSQWLIAIHPNHASYDPAVGLMLDRGGKAPEIRYSQRTSTPRYQYAYESWVTHARRVRDQVAAMHGKHAKGLDWLAKRLNLSNATIAEMTELMALFHDAGKLTEEWQSGAWNWQRLKDMLAGRPQRTWEPVAHTEWAPASDRKLRTKEHQLPNHAVEGAALCAVYLDRRFGEPGLCATTAIARHHAPRAGANRMSRFAPPQDLDKWLSAAGVTEWGSPPVLRDDELDACLLSLSREDDEGIWPLYMYLVRNLRLADQGSLRG